MPFSFWFTILAFQMSGPSNKSDIATAYDRWAETYDTVSNKTGARAAEALREMKLEFAGRDVIEVGCGTGYNTAWLAERGAQVTAMDFSAGMLAKARERLKDSNVRLLHHDVRRPWPLPDDAADLIVSMLILEHVENLKDVFAEAARTLRAGGELFLCELHPMRQLMGGQAQFISGTTGERELVTAFLHNVSDYVNHGLAAGFELRRLDEWRDEGADETSFPRLLSLLFARR